MLIGIPKETRPGERLVAATPKTVAQLRKLGYDVVVESGAGAGANLSDATYEAEGATIGDATAAWGADVVTSVNAPSDESVARLREGATLVAQLAPHSRPELVSALAAAQRTHGRAALALTAGSIMEQVWSALAASGAAQELDWSAVDVFWGDERFVPADSPDRNDAPAERLLFGRAPFSAAARCPMPASDDEYGDDLDAAAAGYAQTLSAARRNDDTEAVPSFDVVLLGIGPDGHCCSLFPDHPSSSDLSAPVIGVRDSPKPPPLRLSLSFDGLNTAREIWVVASGSGKADAAARALAPDADRTHVPSAGAEGRVRTLWLLDRAAAADLNQR